MGGGASWREVGLAGGRWGKLEGGGASWREVGQAGGRWGKLEGGGASWREVGLAGGRWGKLECLLASFLVIKNISGSPLSVRLDSFPLHAGLVLCVLS